MSAEWSADMAISAASDRSLIIWDLIEHQPLRILTMPGSAEVTVLQVNWDAFDRDLLRWRAEAEEARRIEAERIAAEAKAERDRWERLAAEAAAKNEARKLAAAASAEAVLQRR